VTLHGAALAAAMIVSGCGSDAVEHAMAAVSFPSSWEVAKTIAKSGCFPLGDPHCPSATEYFRTPADLVAVYQDARAAVAAEGYAIEDGRPACDGVPDGPRCWLMGRKSGIRLEVTVYEPGRDVDKLGVSIPDHATVRVIVAPG
jgi:hypothetical protein